MEPEQYVNFDSLNNLVEQYVEFGLAEQLNNTLGIVILNISSFDVVKNFKTKNVIHI